MRKFYLSMLMAVGLLISGNAGADGNVPAADDAAAVTAGAVCKIGTDYYSTLALAVADVPETVAYKSETTEFSEGDATQITMLQDVVQTSKVRIPYNKNVILELNGKVISCTTEKVGGFEIIENCGILTIQDNTDTQRNGSTGKITSIAYTPDMSAVPGYASNTILNCGKLTILSGFIESGSLGSASFAIDNNAMNTGSHAPSYGQSSYQNKVELYIQGGKVKANQSNSIRQYMSTNGSCDNIIEVTGGIVYRIWAQEDKDVCIGHLTIKNATLPEGLNIGYEGKSEHFALDIDNTVFGEYFLYKLDPTKEGNTFSIKNSAIGSFYMPNPKPIFTEEDNNIYNFADDINVEWVGDDTGEQSYHQAYYDAIAAWESVEGQYIVDGGEYPGQWVHGYWKAEKSLHGFYDCVKSGGLISVVYEGFDNPYKLGKLNNGNGYGDPDTDEQTTRIDPEGGNEDSNLANYWHKTQTWESAEIPESEDPVVIDHNVIVEAGTTADAASVVIDPNQKLIVEEGATLHIEDAGALFKDGTAQMIIKPTGVVTVGANGVIADNVNNIVVQAQDQEVGVFLVDPKVTINTQPQGTVEMIANVGKNASSENIWHRFALPVVELEQAWTKVPNVGTYLYEWSYDDKDWKLTEGGSTAMVPFLGYTITTNESVQDVKYTFTGNLLGNEASQIDFTNIGYGYFGNSYTGHMLAKVLLGDVMNLEGVVGTAWMWDPQTQSYTGVSMQDLIKDRDLEDYQREIAPMQTFILKLNSGEGATIDIDYADAIWSNPRYGLVPEPVSAPAFMGNDDAFISLKVSSTSGQTDKVRMTESKEYSDEYENGVDAPKFMNEGKINMFTTVGNESYTSLYTNNLEGKILTLQTMEDARYTLTIGSIEGSDYALVDLQTGNIISLVEGTTYDFVAQPNATEERFQVIRTHQAPTSMDKVINNKAAKGIFTPLGQYIGESNSWTNLPSGVYFIDGVKVVK